MQVLSITETQYSGANVIVVAPDSDNLSVLQVLIKCPGPSPSCRTVCSFQVFCQDEGACLRTDEQHCL